MVGTLTGTGVLITRPAHQADNLVSLVEAAGGHALLYPAIEIQPLASEALNQVLSDLGQFDIAIFISANAVTFGLGEIAAKHAELPQGLKLAAVGAATAQALAALGHQPDIAPQKDFRSESLLAHPALQNVAGQHIVIFRGEGGRELLGDTLAARGARVRYAECYRRAQPQADPSEIEQRWAAGEINVVTSTSIESIENLYRMLSARGKELLRTSAIIVISERMARACLQLGLEGDIIVAEAASDSAIVVAIETWRRQQKSL
jgi:uroporphyrinogen-III synthase